MSKLGGATGFLYSGIQFDGSVGAASVAEAGPERKGRAMSRFWRASAIGLLALVTLVSVASARPWGGRVWYGPGWVWYGPGWYYPYWGPGYVPMPSTGNVKMDTPMKDASVYIDGAYAGLAGKLKEIPLRPGSYNIELRDPDGRTLYQQQVRVIAGKTTEIQANYQG